MVASRWTTGWSPRQCPQEGDRAVVAVARRTRYHVKRATRSRQVRSVGGQARIIYSWAQRSIRSRYRQSALAIVWSVIQPVSVIILYAIVFRQILNVNGDGLPYLSFIVCGMVIWRFFTIGLNQSTALVDHANVLGKISFRSEIIPLSAVAAGFVDLAVGTVALVVVAALQGIAPSVHLLGLIPLYLALTFYTAAAAVLIATVTVFARDLAMAMPTITQLLFFATPVMYAIGDVQKTVPWMGLLNPFWFVIEAARDASLRQTWPTPGTTALHVLVSFGLAVLAIAYLRSIEHRIVDIA